MHPAIDLDLQVSQLHEKSAELANIRDGCAEQLVGASDVSNNGKEHLIQGELVR